MRLATPKTPAPGGGLEPAFRLGFLSPDELAGQGVQLLPAAAPPVVNHGMVLNGTTQYGLVQVSQTFPAFQGGRPGELTYYAEFFPDFNYDEAARRVLFDCAAPNRYLLFKEVAAPFFMQFYAGAAVNVGTVSSAVYGPLWRVGQRNRVAAAMISGSNRFFLNGASIGTTVTAWTRVLPTGGLYIGATAVPSLFFDGMITDFRFYSRQLTDAECLEITTVA